MRSADRGAAFAAELLTWDGTPLHEQQAVKGAGCDCKGLMAGAAAELGFAEAASLYATFTAYDLGKPNGVPGALLAEGMAALFDRVPAGAALQLGDILLHRDPKSRRPHHLSAVVSDRTVMHAQGRPTGRVKQTNLAALLTVLPLHSAWRWRDDG